MSVPVIYDLHNRMPGLVAQVDQVVNEVVWGRPEQVRRGFGLIQGESRDTGNTGKTSVLRPGLLMGRVTASKEYTVWSPTATDGSDRIAGVLLGAVRVSLESDADRWYGGLMVGGPIKAGRIVVPGTTAFGISGNALEHVVRAQMADHFQFDDPWQFAVNPFGAWRSVLDLETLDTTGAYTATEALNNTLFHNLTADKTITVTLPAPKPWLRYGFAVTANQTLAVAAASAGQLIAFNDVAANSVTLGTTSQKVGAFIEVIGLSAAKWLVIPHTWTDGTISQTLTIAT